jgi:glucose-1-phosphate adenylyltransferase
LGARTRRGRRRVLALILAGGEGSRLGPLAEERAKPALPFGGIYRLIDFPLSNCVHSGLSDAWVLQQYEPHELTTQLANGRPWDLDRTRGGFRIVHPYVGEGRSGWYQGNADALHRNREVIRGFDADLLLVLSADHVYRLDFGEVIDGHVAGDAAVTIVTTELPPEQDASRYGVVEVARDGRVTGFDYKPDRPRSRVVATEVFLYDAPTLMDTLDELAPADDDEGLGDFGHELLPRLVADGRARGHALDGYWRDVGTLDSYWQSQMDLLEPNPPFVLDDPAWPILTAALQRSPARIDATASLDQSWVAPGAVVRGHVERSILGPGAFVEEGASVRDSILFHDVHVASGATVERTIIDANAVVHPGATVGTAGGEITVVGRGAAARARFAADRDDVA